MPDETPGLSPGDRLIIERARELIRDPKRWTRYASMAIASDGEMAYCAVGAIHQVSNTPASDPTFARRALVHISKRLYGRGLTWVNDRLGHDAVMRVFAVTLGEPDPDGA